MQNKAIIGVAVVGVGLFLFATRTCIGKKLVARALGRTVDCACTGCGETHADSTAQQPQHAEPAMNNAVTMHVMLDKESSSFDDTGCADCGMRMPRHTVELGGAKMTGPLAPELDAAKPIVPMQPPLLRADVAQRARDLVLVTPAPLPSMNAISSPVEFRR